VRYIQSDLIYRFGNTAGEYVMEKGSFAFFSLVIDITIGILQKELRSETCQCIEIQNEGNGGPSTVRIYSWVKSYATRCCRYWKFAD
jgi:hypothetical protein